MAGFYLARGLLGVGAMMSFNPMQKTGYGMPGSVSQPVAAQAATSAKADFSFGDFLDVINPLQHIPVVSTLYRAITGDKIETPEKIAGDTLYGGFWGAVSSLADSAFEAVTGKDVGDTVLALFTGTDSKQVASSASAAPAKVTANPPAAPDMTQDIAALSASMTAKGVDGDLARRALSAYRQTMLIPNAALAQ